MKRLLLSYACLLALCGCRDAGRADSTEAPPGAAERTRIWSRFAGSIDSKYPITLDLTVDAEGSRGTGHGEYRYDRYGVVIPVTASISDTGFEITAHPDDGAAEVFRGRSFRTDGFEGSWNRTRPDSTFDSTASEWKVSPGTRTRSFRVSRADTGFLPVRFELHRRENDSGARERKRQGRYEHGYDTLPSSLALSLLIVDRAGAAADSLNRGIARALLASIGATEGIAFPENAADIGLALADFDRRWKGFRGEYFSVDFDCQVEGNEKGVLAVRLSYNAYAGGAHGSHSYRLGNFDAGTGRMIPLEDILTPGFEALLGRLAGEPSCDPEFEVPCVIEGILRNGFAIKHDGLEFNAEIGSRTRRVLIPYGKLAPVILPDGILARFVRP